MKTHKVSVTVATDSIAVDPPTLTMTSVDEVHWFGTTARKFSIVFDGTSPFQDKELTHAAATSKQRPRSKGRFKYSVVSEENPALQLDPVIIVEDPPSGVNP